MVIQWRTKFMNPMKPESSMGIIYVATKELIRPVDERLT